jgi:hypothetical protein
MKLKLLAKDTDSGKAGCPSVYLAEDGSLVVQGHLLDSAILLKLSGQRCCERIGTPDAPSSAYTS